MSRQQVALLQQSMIGDIKIDRKAQLDRTYTRLLLDAFIPYRGAMLVYDIRANNSLIIPATIHALIRVTLWLYETAA
jgi:hypothetical protein